MLPLSRPMLAGAPSRTVPPAVTASVPPWFALAPIAAPAVLKVEPLSTETRTPP